MKYQLLIPFLLVVSGITNSQSNSYLEFSIDADISIETMGTPIAASNTHMFAIMGNDPEFMAQTVTFPFIHVGNDGSKFIAQYPDDMRSSVGRRQYNTRMISVTELENNGTVAVVRAEFQRYDLEGNATVKGSALWGLRKENEYWKVSWRQFLGVGNKS